MHADGKRQGVPGARGPTPILSDAAFGARTCAPQPGLLRTGRGKLGTAYRCSRCGAIGTVVISVITRVTHDHEET
jgi:hypothetical protein